MNILSTGQRFRYLCHSRSYSYGLDQRRGCKLLLYDHDHVRLLLNKTNYMRSFFFDTCNSYIFFHYTIKTIILLCIFTPPFIARTTGKLNFNSAPTYTQEWTHVVLIWRVRLQRDINSVSTSHSVIFIIHLLHLFDIDVSACYSASLLTKSLKRRLSVLWQESISFCSFSLSVFAACALFFFFLPLSSCFLF